MTDNQTTKNQTSDDLNKQALYAVHDGLRRIRSIALEMQLHLRNTEYAENVNLLKYAEAIEGIADYLHNIPKLVSDQAEYDTDLMQLEIEASRSSWSMWNYVEDQIIAESEMNSEVKK